MSLFLRIFLWFWFTMALIVGAVTLVNWSMSSGPLAKQYRNFVREAVNLHAQTAAQIYVNEGEKGLRSYFERLESRRRINSVAFFDEQKQIIYGKRIENAESLLSRLDNAGEPNFLREEKVTLVGLGFVGEDGKKYYFMLERRRFQPPPFFGSRLMYQILAVILVGGLVSYALARYLSSPINKLRGATQLLADGNFDTRIAEQIGKRGDEVGSLARDFDEMAKRIEALITSEKRLTQDISHELRSPLARMNVALELARKKADSDTLPLLGRLESESEKLNQLISQLLTLSKLEAGVVDFEKTKFNLTNLVEQIVDDTNFEAQGMDRGTVLIDKVNCQIEGNELLIRSAIENVIRNANRYTEKGTEVEVSLKEEANDFKIKIRDFGTGVDEEEIVKLFKPFYRVSVARDRKSGGAGLGLAIAKEAVTSHGGEIFARNVDPGLLVTIVLPKTS